MRALWLACLVACGYPALPKIGSNDARNDAPRDAHTDATADATSGGDAMPDGPATPMLKVKNYLSWCSVGINGATMSTAAVQTINSSPGMSYSLVGTAASTTFKLGSNMWHHTDADTANQGEPGIVSGNVSTSSVTATNGVKCVWVCCPFQDGSGCPTTDQCP